MTPEAAALALLKSLNLPEGAANVLTWHETDVPTLRIWVEERYIWHVKRIAPKDFEGFHVDVEVRPVVTAYRTAPPTIAHHAVHCTTKPYNVTENAMNEKATNTVQIEATVQWRYFQEPEEGRFVGDCDALGLTIEGKTHHEMTERIHHAQSMMFRYLLESGELPHFLERHHWKMHGSLPKSPQEAQFELPFDLVRETTNGAAHYAH